VNLTTLRTEIQERAADSSLTSTVMDRWINMAIKQWATRADWPSNTEQDSTIPTVAGTVEYSLPSDFKKMISVRVGSSEVDGDEFTFIEYKDKNISTQGMWYYLNPDDATVGLIPTPASVETVYLKYYEIPADLTVVTEEPPFPANYHELVIFFALKKYWEVNDDFEKSRYYDVEFEEMIDKMKLDLKVRATGQLKRIKDIRELNSLNNPQGINAINTGQ